MKNCLKLGLIALIIGVAASAFTTVNATHNNKKAQELYWYEFDAATNQLTAQIGSSKITRSEAESSSCQETTGQDCARAYSTQQSVPESNPPAGEDHIQKGL